MHPSRTLPGLYIIIESNLMTTKDEEEEPYLRVKLYMYVLRLLIFFCTPVPYELDFNHRTSPLPIIRSGIAVGLTGTSGTLMIITLSRD